MHGCTARKARPQAYPRQQHKPQAPSQVKRCLPTGYDRPGHTRYTPRPAQGGSTGVATVVGRGPIEMVFREKRTHRSPPPSLTCHRGTVSNASRTHAAAPRRARNVVRPFASRRVHAQIGGHLSISLNNMQSRREAKQGGHASVVFSSTPHRAREVQTEWSTDVKFAYTFREEGKGCSTRSPGNTCATGGEEGGEQGGLRSQKTAKCGRQREASRVERSEAAEPCRAKAPTERARPRRASRGRLRQPTAPRWGHCRGQGRTGGTKPHLAVEARQKPLVAHKPARRTTRKAMQDRDIK